ncbi:MAG: hypothetical protein V3V20_09105 [Algisphaera sp.]
MQEFDPEIEENDDPESMSLSGVAGGGMLPVDDDFVVGGDDAKKVTQQSILIGAIVTVVAFGAILGMRFVQTDMSAAAASEETIKWMAVVESEISNMDKMSKSNPLHPENVNKLFRDTDGLIEMITDDQMRFQVPVEQVQMNPFKPLEGVAIAPEDPAKLARAARREQLEEAYNELDNIEVQSILGGAKPRAFIGGELYEVGDTLGVFQISSIGRRHIGLELEGIVTQPGERPFRLGIKTDR